MCFLFFFKILFVRVTHGNVLILLLVGILGVLMLMKIGPHYLIIVYLRNTSACMRFRFQQEPEEKADILVSELLGSWGDNELSPECLDGAQRFLKEGGVSIPQEYTSFVAPMSSHKV